jgi:hypothetical protein
MIELKRLPKGKTRAKNEDLIKIKTRLATKVLLDTQVPLGLIAKIVLRAHFLR